MENNGSVRDRMSFLKITRKDEVQRKLYIKKKEEGTVVKFGTPAEESSSTLRTSVVLPM